MEEIKNNLSNSHRISHKIPENMADLKKGQPSGTFGTILESSLSNSKPSETQKIEPSSLGELFAPEPLLSMDDIDLPAAIDTALDLFEHYTTLLGDPTRTLRQITPVLNDLTQKTQLLAENIQDASSVDTRLTAIIDQISSHAAMEQFRLERGDYSDRQ